MRKQILIISILLSLLISICVSGQTLIHELPIKSAIDTSYLFLQGHPNTGKLYKSKIALLQSGLVFDADKGDIIVSGSNTIYTIDGGVVSNGKMANMANNTFKGNISGGLDMPSDLTVNQMVTALGINLKLTASDTTALSNRINLKLTGSDTAALSGRINLKLTAADTSSLSGRIDLKQPLDADLTSLSGAAGTNTIYYRSGVDTWTPVSIGTNITFSSGTISASGGGGGSQTLDQTLGFGNTTSEIIVFEPTTSDLDYPFIRIDPIDTFSSQVPFRFARWNSPQNSGAVAGNEGIAIGFNVGSGGGLIESGKPAIGEMWESNYLPDFSTRYVEKHEVYIPSVTAGGLTAGTQVRLSSYTINTATNNLDLYRTVGREYLFVPGTSVQYWLVQPGSFVLQNGAGTQGVNHSVSANRYQIAATGVDTTMSLAGFDYVNFGGAAIEDMTLPAFLNLYYDTLTAAVLQSFKIMSLTNTSEYILFDPQPANDALVLYGNGLNKIWTNSITELRMNFASSNTGYFTGEGITFSGAGAKWIYADDLTAKLGVNASFRFSEAWVRDGHFNQMAVQSKAGDPTTSDVAAGMWMVWKNTTSGDTYLYMNDGGTMKRIASAFVTF